MTSPPIDSTHGRQRKAWHEEITALGQHTRAWHAIIALGRQTRSNDVRRGMSSSPLGSTKGRTASGVACHRRLGAAHMVSNVGRGMTSPPLDCTHGRTTSGVSCDHRLWAAQTVELRRAWHAIISLGRQTWSNDVRRGMPSLPLGIDVRTASSNACHHRLWPAHTFERRWAWNTIIAFG